MAPIHNVAVERPEMAFEVDLIIFGSVSRNAVRRTISVLAQTAKGARKICKMRYRRSEVKRVRAGTLSFAEFFYPSLHRESGP